MYSRDLRIQRHFGIAYSHDERRQYVEADEGRHFERACPQHRQILGGITELWCPRGHSVDAVEPYPLARTYDAFATMLRWLIVEVVDGLPGRTAGYVYGGRVEWARWFVDAYPTVITFAGRTADGMTRAAILSGTNVRARASELRRTGLGREAAQREAERRALARLTVEMERIPA
jgi:hypothetical protein